ncbi:MAG: T9SS type A sorting domain-containing protein [Flavobacteriales bacterium]|nr:T9SS type A sorting domain-containing protein [Flavobacteriales bacterium]
MLKLSSFRSVASVAVLCAFTSSGTAQTVQWMRQGGWGGQGQGIAYDASENCYVVGMVGDPALFDQDTMASHFADAFIAKYDPAGVLQWVRTGGGELAEQASDIVVDAAGNAYVTGYIATNGVLPTVEFDGTVITGLGATDLFVAKYDPSGTLQWFRYGGGALAEQGRGIAFTPDGDLVVSGFFQGTAVFGADTLVSAGLGDIVLLKYDTNGNQLWSARNGGPGDEQAGKLTTLPNGDIAMVGEFQQTVVFGGSSITSTGLANIFLARYNAAGDALWAVRAGSTTGFAADVAFDIDHAANGDLVFCGEIAGTADFGGLTVPTNGSLDVFIARYDGTGAPIWVRHGGGPQQDHAYGVSVDADGNSYLTGQADDGASTMFDSILLAPFGNESVFLAKYDAAGAVQWVRRYAPGSGRAVATLPGGCLYFTGGASGIVGQPAFDSIPWQYVDRAIFSAQFCAPLSTALPDETTTSQFLLYPNPVADVLTVQLAHFKIADAELQLLDATGRVVQRARVRTGQQQVDVSALPTAVYQAILLQGNAVQSAQIVIMR